MNTQLNDKKNAKITSYKFKSFNKVIKENVEDANEVKKYEFSSLENVKQIIKEKEKNLVDFISKNSQAKGFNISPIVREHKGFKDRDLQEREARIAEEIEKRFNRIKQQGFEQGYNEGFEEGKVEVYNQTKVATEEKLDALTSMISETLKTQEELLVNQKKQIYYMIRNLTKWIILKELKDDGAYIERLLERLLIEMNAKKNILIRVNNKDFERMPDVLAVVQKKLGSIENVRVEVDYETSKNGINLECDNGIINGTFEEQFRTMDRLFHAVGINEEFFKVNTVQDEVTLTDLKKINE
ncbi:MAG: hypothetical protein A2202_03450 [Bdellovibrionales bacterium RIFOXYA1_FULL_36_14]|nr:MAG: hypothetical protein A2202_03450 [Bdellovibrionales bacterium RIFOXYA1_FULL_36_14]